MEGRKGRSAAKGGWVLSEAGETSQKAVNPSPEVPNKTIIHPVSEIERKVVPRQVSTSIYIYEYTEGVQQVLPYSQGLYRRNGCDFYSQIQHAFVQGECQS